MKTKSGFGVGLALLLLVLLGSAFWLIKRGPDLSPASQKLFLGLNSNHMETVSAAMQQGADVNARDEFGYTPLMRAVMAGTSAAVPILVDKGADINAKTNGNETVLMIAIKFRRIQSILVLLDHKADPNVRGIDGQTALSLARGYRLPDVVARLEALGATR